MSQRIHNLDVHSEMYAAKLKCESSAKKLPGKLVKGRDSQILTKGATMTSIPRNQISTRSAGIKPDAMVRKELFTADNSAMVEVTVKTHNTRQRSRSNSQIRSPKTKDPWNKILKQQSSNENISSFTNFDPLRTLHFLAKELQCKLQNILPHDITIQQMICEMQQALTRVPPDVPSSTIQTLQKVDYLNREKIDMQPTKLCKNTKDNYSNTISNYISGSAFVNGESQTPPNLFAEPEKLQQHLEESSEKIDKACRQMETLCAKLKSEKDELENLLKAEKQVVKDLNDELDELKLKYNSADAVIQSLKARSEELESEMRILKSNEGQTSPQATTELKNLVEELQKQKFDAEEECMLLKQQLTIASMEVEKYEAILQARDSQVKEIRNEMSQLQEVVNEQLLELQNNPYSSDASTYSNTTGSSIWQDTIIKDRLPSEQQNSMNSVEMKHNNIHMKQSQEIKECPYGDNSLNDDLKNITNYNNSVPRMKLRKRNVRVSIRVHQLDKLSSLIGNHQAPASSFTGANIHEKFAEITKQALQCKPTNYET